MGEDAQSERRVGVKEEKGGVAPNAKEATAGVLKRYSIGFDFRSTGRGGLTIGSESQEKSDGGDSW